MSIVSLTRDQILRLAPNARSAYLAAFATADTDLAPFGVNATKLRLVHFLAQVCHETDGLSIRVESMNYSAARLPQVWPSRFRDPAVARKYAHDPKGLAEHVYGGRMGNGPEGSGDGWAFIGHGLLQITGREAYETYGAQLGIPLAGEPDLAFSSDWSLKIAAAEWAASGRAGATCNELADADDLAGVTRAINGGLVGLSSRREWLRRWKRVYGL
ncbi:MAG: glycoside hydrolase family 19 protein [Phyllobacteriaceae bacterium]|nr:glycoside hydrolase family 19 protein [Phyllobacteriaceae bacterium]